MADLPAKPSLDHLRRQARDLLRAAQAGDTTAAGRIRAVADALTLASAQLAVAREYGGWTPLRCAVAGAANPLITRLLLERGAVPGDHDLYLAGFGDDNHECLRLLLFHAADVAQLARMALAAPISLNDAEGAQLLLEAGADPNRYADDADPLSPVIYAAIRSGCSAGLTGLLLGYGADPHIPRPDGRSPYVLAVTQGRTGLAMLLRQHGADVTVTGTDRLLAACQDADRAKVERE